MYFVIYNDMGFVNTAEVAVFKTKEAAEKWAANHKRSEVTKSKSEATRALRVYHTDLNDIYRPKPFTGEKWLIDSYYKDDFYDEYGDDYLGRIVVGYENDSFSTPLYK